VKARWLLICDEEVEKTVVVKKKGSKKKKYVVYDFTNSPSFSSFPVDAVFRSTVVLTTDHDLGTCSLWLVG
jgi:hypothetical protein